MIRLEAVHFDSQFFARRRQLGVGAVVRSDRLPADEFLRRAYPGDWLSLALSGGEDYELLFTVPEEKLEALEREARGPGPRITRIGTMTEATEGVVVVEPDGRARPLSEEGFNHFRTNY